ncbi:MAG: GNAT family N-acetyltransferase [Acidobacteria bacterium]|nr:GNAT family N-acetyltransferase [Acidobacteriota bacterium]
MTNTISTEISFRSMRPGDIPSGLRLCRAAHWNQTGRDWELFIKLSPQGCRVALRNEYVIGTVATVCYEDRFSWIGMVLVDPAERGQGIAGSLMAEAMNALKDMPSTRLDATPAGHAVYRKLGFVDEYTLSRMEVVADRRDFGCSGNPGRPMTERDLPDVAIFDRDVFGADRHVILEWMFDGAPEYAWITEERGRITGYAFGRHGFNFEQIGPVVALDQQDARHLVAACLSQGKDKRFILDATHHESDWRAWLESIGFIEQRPFIRMFYRDNPFPGMPHNQFAILGPEFG